MGKEELVHDNSTHLHILGLSNGHGEDAIGAQILQAIRQVVQRENYSVTVSALPLVGEGNAYERADIPCISAVRSRPPSGGFLYMDPRQLWRDLQGGLIGVTLRQWQLVKHWTQDIQRAGGQPFVLAAGDIVPLLFAWRSQSPYGFVGTAKSEYYLRDSDGNFLRSRRMEGWSGSVYLPWERWLMGRPRCQAVFPRDRLTAEILNNFTIPAADLGNPMMDGFLPALDGDDQSDFALSTSPSETEPLRLLIVPGSRSPEAYNNWTQLIELATAIVNDQPHRAIALEGAIATGLEIDQLAQLLPNSWQPKENQSDGRYSWCWGNASLNITVGQFYQQALDTHLGLAMAGTATEQLVGLGRPVITLAGQGPQFTPAFAEAQTRLLGPSIFLAEDTKDGVDKVRSLLQNPQQWSAIARNGRDRLGVPGAANRIAKHLLKNIHSCAL
ncbi:MAG: lipid-A-disaccharide synthase-related protein [Cyanobacteria bacterium P01_D01_bin.73]